MQVIRLCKYAMIRRTIWTAVILVLLCALPFVAFADKPPAGLYQHVTQTAQLVHQGECNVKSLNKMDTKCLIFYNAAIDRVWVVLFDTDKGGNPQVTHVLMVDEVGQEKTAWCRQDVCL